jgi:hypothetical protein
MAEENDTNFKITDRRKFNADGSPRDYHDEIPEPKPSQTTEPAAQETGAPAEQANVEQANREQSSAEPSESDSAKVVSFQERKREQAQSEAAGAADEKRSPFNRSVSASEQAYSQMTGAQPRALPEATFLSLINMLAVEAAMHLGLIETPGEASPVIDLEAARHMIDMLGVLEQKTRGNLSGDEDKLLENILADLRMQYVALSRRR